MPDRHAVPETGRCKSAPSGWSQLRCEPHGHCRAVPETNPRADPVTVHGPLDSLGPAAFSAAASACASASLFTGCQGLITVKERQPLTNEPGWSNIDQ